MDGIVVRPLKFALSDKCSEDCIWSRTSPQFSVFLNAVGIHVPHFERYLIAALRKAKPRISDERLRKDVASIIGQEAHHASNFEQLTRQLFARYPKLRAIDARSRRYFASHAERDDFKRLIGFTAGYETFSFLAGLIILDNHAKWFEDSEPSIKAFWIWHQVEEVEHGSVAFDVYQYFYGDDEVYRKWMVFVALSRLCYETVVAFMHMANVEGWFKRPGLALSKMAFCCAMLFRFAKNGIPAFRRGYHPRRHPMVTSTQNPIQQGWRRFHQAGGDVLAIDRNKMDEILGGDR